MRHNYILNKSGGVGTEVLCFEGEHTTWNSLVTLALTHNLAHEVHATTSTIQFEQHYSPYCLDRALMTGEPPMATENAEAMHTFLGRFTVNIPINLYLDDGRYFFSGN